MEGAHRAGGVGGRHLRRRLRRCGDLGPDRCQPGADQRRLLHLPRQRGDGAHRACRQGDPARRNAHARRYRLAAPHADRKARHRGVGHQRQQPAEVCQSAGPARCLRPPRRQEGPARGRGQDPRGAGGDRHHRRLAADARYARRAGQRRAAADHAGDQQRQHHAVVRRARRNPDRRAADLQQRGVPGRQFGAEHGQFRRPRGLSHRAGPAGAAGRAAAQVRDERVFGGRGAAGRGRHDAYRRRGRRDRGGQPGGVRHRRAPAVAQRAETDQRREKPAGQGGRSRCRGQAGHAMAGAEMGFLRPRHAQGAGAAGRWGDRQLWRQDPGGAAQGRRQGHAAAGADAERRALESCGAAEGATERNPGGPPQGDPEGAPRIRIGTGAALQPGQRRRFHAMGHRRRASRHAAVRRPEGRGAGAGDDAGPAGGQLRAARTDQPESALSAGRQPRPPGAWLGAGRDAIGRGGAALQLLAWRSR
ncbi:hypothetical protein CBM2626_B120246 [Cupriavidus taiwanensis]|nr:hypothetical protein CBM2626_B120246 [Cupriavidus taiwanensis]